MLDLVGQNYAALLWPTSEQWAPGTGGEGSTHMARMVSLSQTELVLSPLKLPTDGSGVSTDQGSVL